jgi:flagellar hook assembly protein FlgD
MKKLLLLTLTFVTLCLAANVFAATDLDGVIVYPNPINFSKGQTTITFDNLTDDVVIKIYKTNGQLVKTIEATGTGGTVAWWNVTNDSGKKLGAGIYIYLITNNAGQKAKGKFAVIK